MSRILLRQSSVHSDTPPHWLIPKQHKRNVERRPTKLQKKRLKDASYSTLPGNSFPSNSSGSFPPSGFVPPHDAYPNLLTYTYYPSLLTILSLPSTQSRTSQHSAQHNPVTATIFPLVPRPGSWEPMRTSNHASCTQASVWPCWYFLWHQHQHQARQPEAASYSIYRTVYGNRQTA